MNPRSRPDGTRPLRLPLLSLAALALLLASCRVDQTGTLEELRASMSPMEIQFYLEYATDPADDGQETGLVHQAARRGYLATLQILEARGMNLQQTDGAGFTTLMAAAEGGSLEVVRFMVEKTGSDVRLRTGHRYTALMWAIMGGHREVSRYLLDRGSNINAKTSQGFTPLMMAAARGDAPLVRLLLDRGASPDLADNRGRVARDHAVEQEVLDLLGAAP